MSNELSGSVWSGRGARRGAAAARGTRGPLLAVAAVAGALLAWAPGAAQAQHCKMHYSEAFQLISTRSLAGQSAVEIKRTVDDLFGPGQPLCGEYGYNFLLSELKTYATTAFRKKGPEGVAMRQATREIITRLPHQVRFPKGGDPVSGLKQLRSDLGVLGSEVGMTPDIQAVIDDLGKVVPPKLAARPLPADDDAVSVVVPRVPLPAWAVISLYEIRDHAKLKENGAILNKANLILDWMAKVNSGVPAGSVKVTATPPAAAPAPAAPAAKTPAPAHP